MYLVMRRGTDGSVTEVCFVQAKSAEKAKEMVGVPAESTDWVSLPIDVLNQLASAKEGYIVKAL